MSYYTQTSPGENGKPMKQGKSKSMLFQDFILWEKIRSGSGLAPFGNTPDLGPSAHGYFRVYTPMAEYTKAQFLQNPNSITPVFVRFSSLAGLRGADAGGRDAQGFAVKFYTREGIFDLVGSNIPVYFIQDSLKFPDLHAFWDFASLMPESIHMMMWLMSDHVLPRSMRTMEGFGIHTFRFINDAGSSTFVKFHWKPLSGTYSITWDEMQKITTTDPLFHRRDLWEAIENGHYPEWELGVQLVHENDRYRFDFDILDPTKLIPEELVPVNAIGRLTLNRNPANFFDETEQVHFYHGNTVPGIDLGTHASNGRQAPCTGKRTSITANILFQEVLSRKREGLLPTDSCGFARQQHAIPATPPQEEGCPFRMKTSGGVFTGYEEQDSGQGMCARGKSFLDHFSQAALFYRSQSPTGQQHIAQAICHELGQLKSTQVKTQVVALLHMADNTLAAAVADVLGMVMPEPPPAPGTSITPARSEALSLGYRTTGSIEMRQVAVLCATGVWGSRLQQMVDVLEAEGAVVKLVAPVAGKVCGADDTCFMVDEVLPTCSSVFFDAMYIPGGEKSIAALRAEPATAQFLNEAYRHGKPIAADEAAWELIGQTNWGKAEKPVAREQWLEKGIVKLVYGIERESADFIRVMSKYRFWNRSEA